MYIKEDGKTFWVHGDGTLTRAHDENFSGMRFEHRRCPFCNRITSTHPLHWINHIEKCAPIKYTYDNLFKMRHTKLEDINCYYKDGESGR
jgi:hypothetical protein